MTLTEVRILSRGGQGGVTAAKMLAYAGLKEDMIVQAIPKYGSERKGAPIFADVRLADEDIRTHAPVIDRNCDSYIIFDVSAAEKIMPMDQVKSGAVVVVNGTEVPDFLKKRMPEIKVGLVDAIKIAKECNLIRSGTPLISTTMLGAWAKANEGMIKLDSIKKSIEHAFGKGEVMNQNIKSVELAFDEFEFVE
ncbi:MAG: 2-oxoacid:acceptor oxidoreductase family protein [Candidatus Heimdallarchaeota archaeon]